MPSPDSYSGFYWEAVISKPQYCPLPWNEEQKWSCLTSGNPDAIFTENTISQRKTMMMSTFWTKIQHQLWHQSMASQTWLWFISWPTTINQHHAFKFFNIFTPLICSDALMRVDDDDKKKNDDVKPWQEFWSSPDESFLSKDRSGRNLPDTQTFLVLEDDRGRG